MATRFASILGVLLLAALVIAGPALGDGDPASDTLLGQNVFYPYSPPTSQAAEKALNAATAAAKRAGFPIKVALIAAPSDLGVIPDLFGKPQKYADFLDQEISFQGRQPLMVVMAAGYGLQGVSELAVNAAHGLKPPSGRTSTALAQAAVIAVAKLAAAAGHPLKGVPGISGSGAGGSGAGGSTTIIVVALLVAAVLVAGALLVVRRRQQAAGASSSS